MNYAPSDISCKTPFMPSIESFLICLYLMSISLVQEIKNDIPLIVCSRKISATVGRTDLINSKSNSYSKAAPINIYASTIPWIHSIETTSNGVKPSPFFQLLTVGSAPSSNNNNTILGLQKKAAL